MPTRLALQTLLDSQLEVATLDRQISRMKKSHRSSLDAIDEMQQMSDRRYDASMNKTKEAVGALIEHGADIRKKPGQNRRSALGYAKEMFDTDSPIVQHMIEKEQEFQGQRKNRSHVDRYHDSKDKGPDECEVCNIL